MPLTTYEIDPVHSSVQFAIRHLMVSTFRGEFTKVSGTVKYNADEPEDSFIDATIDAASISTREPQRDTHLKSADFFDVEKYPALSFHSIKIRIDAGGGRIIGDLTIHGVTKEVELAAESSFEEIKDPWGKQRLGISATTKVSRKDFGLTWNPTLEAGGAMIGDEVKIMLEIQLIRS